MITSGVHSIFLFTKANEVLSRLDHGRSHVDKKEKETDSSQLREKIPSKRTYRMKNVWVADTLGQFFVTGPFVPAETSSQCYCQIWGQDVSVITHEIHEILRHFPGTKRFHSWPVGSMRTQMQACVYFRLKLPYRALVGTVTWVHPQSPLGCQRPGIFFYEDLIMNSCGAVDPILPILAKMSSLVEVPMILVSCPTWSKLTQTLSKCGPCQSHLWSRLDK